MLIYARSLIFLIRFDTILVRLTDVYTHTSCANIISGDIWVAGLVEFYKTTDQQKRRIMNIYTPYEGRGHKHMLYRDIRRAFCLLGAVI